jgi:two-component system, NarL family, response regulator LiaR
MDHLLTDREQHIMDLISQGKSNPEIAAELQVSVNTVKTHLRHVFKKLEVDNRTQASVRYLNLR